MSEPFIPFAPPDIGEAEIAAVTEVLRSGWITRGPRCAEFEERFAAAIGAKHAVLVNSATAAMHLALEAAGIGAGDEVIVPAMTFCSTALVVEHVGATPVLADVDPVTLNITAATIEAVASERTRAVIPVHYAGDPVELTEIDQLARQHDWLVLEDAAHAVGSAIAGVPVGSGERLASFSFYATKNLCTGEGGMLVGPQELVDRARLLSLHGMDRDAWKRYDRGGRWRYDVAASGWKYNATDLQAVLGLVQLERLPALQARRHAVADRYRALLGDCPLLQLPAERDGTTHAWHLFVAQLQLADLTIDRDGVINALSAAGIGSSVHFIPLHQHSHFQQLHGWTVAQVPVADAAADRVLSLPMNSRITDDDIARVASSLREILERGAR